MMVPSNLGDSPVARAIIVINVSASRRRFSGVTRSRWFLTDSSMSLMALPGVVLQRIVPLHYDEPRLTGTLRRGLPGVDAHRWVWGRAWFLHAWTTGKQGSR